MARRAAPFVVVIVAIALFDLRWHEFWRDEANAMLEARAVPWGAFLEAMRVEGIPPLFHVLLKIAGAVLPNPLALVAVGALDLGVLLFGTYRLLVALSGAPRAAARVTLALSFTYVYAYELGAVIRQYTLGLGLALLSFAYLRDALRLGDRRAVRAGALAAGLAALASAHSACVAGGALLSFGLISLARRRSIRGWWPILLTLPAFALVVYLAAPYPGRTGEANLAQSYPPGVTLRLSLQALVEGVMPHDWWHLEAFLPRRLADVVAALRSLAFWGVLTGAGVALAARILALRGRWRTGAFEVIAVLGSLPPLLVIIVLHYWGFYRHHLFLGMPLLVVLAGWGLDAGLTGPIAGAARRLGLALLAPWLLFQAVLGAGSFALDQRYPFSDTKAAARMLPPEARLITDTHWRSTGVMFWRPDVQMRSAGWNGRRYRYIRPDQDWFRNVSIPPIVAEECRAAPDRVYFAGVAASLGALGRCASPVAYPKSPFETQPFTWETFDLFRMDCSCVTRGR